MQYREEKTLETIVNTKGTKLWIKMNDNSKAQKNRNLFVQQHGGFFIKEGSYWKWKCEEDKLNGYWLKKVDTEEKVFFENMSEFAKTHDIGIVKICELLNGKRKTYKGWTAVEVRAVKEGTGSHTKIKKKKPKKIAMTKVASVQDITTNEIFIIDNMYDFAKKNNLNYSNLKKLINGKSKTYKNLKLYNPIEKYQIFEEPK